MQPAGWTTRERAAPPKPGHRPVPTGALARTGELREQHDRDADRDHGGEDAEGDEARGARAGTAGRAKQPRRCAVRLAASGAGTSVERGVTGRAAAGEILQSRLRAARAPGPASPSECQGRVAAIATPSR